MAEPARRNAEGPEPDDPERKPDPRAGGWADVRRVVIADADLVALSAAEVAARPDDDRARLILGRAVESFESAIVIAGRCAVDEEVVEAERRRAYAKGVADCKAARCRLGVIDGGRAGPH